MYYDPRTAIYPKSRLSNLNVVIDNGSGSFALALLLWDSNERVGIRWNGGSGGTYEDVGNPQSRGKPTWMIMPNEVALSFLRATLAAGKISTSSAHLIEEFIQKNS